MLLLLMLESMSAVQVIILFLLIIKQMSKQISFTDNLKISHWFSSEGDAYNQMDLNKVITTKPDQKIMETDQVQIDYDTVYSYHKNSKLMNSTLKKQRPPIMEHSQLNFQSTSSYLPDHKNFKASDFYAEIKQSRTLSTKKNSKIYQFKESEILDKKNSPQMPTFSNQSVIQVLQKFDQKLQMQKKNQMLIIQAESSSEEQCKFNKVMSISQQHQIMHPKGKTPVALEKRFTQFDESSCHKLHKAQQQDKILSQSRQRQSLTYNQVDANDIKQQKIQQSNNLLMSSNNVTFSSKKGKKIQNIQQTTEKIHIKYAQHIKQLEMQHKALIAKKQMQNVQLTQDISYYKGKNLQLELKLLEIENQEQTKSENSKQILSSIKHYEFQIQTLKIENKNSKKQLQEKDQLIYSLSKELQLINESLLNNLSSYDASIDKHKPKGITIQFIQPKNEKSSYQAIKQFNKIQSEYIKNLEQLIIKYQQLLTDKNQTIRRLQNYICDVTKDSIYAQKTIKKLSRKLDKIIMRKQELEESLALMTQKFFGLNNKESHTSSGASRNSGERKKSEQQSKQFAQDMLIGSQPQQNEGESNCSTVKF